MKLTILGIWGGYPKAGSATSALLLEESDFRLLIDCGSGSLAQLQKYTPLDQLDALILSHYHHDHIADVGCLQYGMLIDRQLGKRKLLFPIYGHAHDEHQFESLTFGEYTQGYEIDHSRSLEIGPWNVSFCLTEHPAYCLAMKFSSQGKTLVFTADTAWSDSLVDFAQEADLLICESNLYNEQLGQVKGHMTAGGAGRLAAQANVKELILTHLPHYGNPEILLEQAQEMFPGPTRLAEVGLQIDVQ